jgi:hypothetical protein
MEMSAAIMGNAMEALQNGSSGATTWSHWPTTGFAPKARRLLSQGHVSLPWSPQHCLQDTKATQEPIKGWMDKENAYVHNGILVSHEKGEPDI